MANTVCKCSFKGKRHGLMNQLLQKNNLDGEIQKPLMSALHTSLLKAANICLVGGADCGNFLFEGLRKLN